MTSARVCIKIETYKLDSFFVYQYMFGCSKDGPNVSTVTPQVMTIGGMAEVLVSRWTSHLFFVICEKRPMQGGTAGLKALEDKILREGTVLPGHILKVGSFLNQQLDSDFLMEMGQEIARLFAEDNVTKILTIESSGIAIAVAAGMAMHVPAVFAKKNKSSNVSGEVFKTVVHSYTHNTDYDVVVSKEYLGPNDRVLLVDDFLANGKALEGLRDIVMQSGATLVGAAIAIEKGFQHGGDTLRENGVRVESLAIVDQMDDNAVYFRR